MTSGAHRVSLRLPLNLWRFAWHKGTPGWRVTKLPCSHDVMVDLPKELAKELMILA